MKEKILKIEKTEFKHDDKSKSYYNLEGYKITTDRQVIKLGIDNGQSCCENWGYFMSEDDVQSFVGSILIGIELTDTQLKKVEEFDIDNSYEGDAMFVNLKTNNGLLQFVAYNEHNGYYGHEACVISKQLSHTTIL